MSLPLIPIEVLEGTKLCVQVANLNAPTESEKRIQGGGTLLAYPLNISFSAIVSPFSEGDSRIFSLV